MLNAKRVLIETKICIHKAGELDIADFVVDRILPVNPVTVEKFGLWTSVFQQGTNLLLLLITTIVKFAVVS